MEPKYVQDTLHGNFQPFWDYETQVSLGIMHSDQPYMEHTPKYHYHDCKCFECYKFHYPCSNADDCLYCQLVHKLMYRYEYDVKKRESCFVRTGLEIKAQYGHIIDYLTYEQLGDIELDDEDDITWRECRGCEILIPRCIYYKYDDYCSKECRDNDCSIYCRSCYCVEVKHHGDRCRDCTIYCYGNDGNCEQEVEREGDLCEYCKDDEYDEPEEEQDNAWNTHGYSYADIVDPAHYTGLMNCWIDKRGRVRYVPYCNHDYTATCMGYTGTWDAERNGCIHFSEYWDSFSRWRYIPDRPTNAQIDTMVALCLANKDNLAMPEFIVKYMEEQRNKQSQVTYVGPMTTRAYYTLPLATRRAMHQGD